MPPKKGADKASKKTEQKRKEKVIEDKTFGLKNKKGAKNQKYIAQVEKQVKQGGDPKARRIEEERLAEKKRREEAKRLEEEAKKLFRPVVVEKQNVEAGKSMDPCRTAGGFMSFSSPKVANSSTSSYVKKFMTKRWSQIYGAHHKSRFNFVLGLSVFTLRTLQVSLTLTQHRV